MLGVDAVVSIRWACSGDNPRKLASFFMENAPAQYVSHGEIQDGRAKGIGVWSSSLESILANQFSLACERQADGDFPETRLALATDPQMTVIGIGYVGIKRAAPTPYAVLYDLLIRADARSAGVGSGLLAWIEEQLRMGEINLLFLESGINNTRAHGFFESAGFVPVSVTFMKTL